MRVALFGYSSVGARAYKVLRRMGETVAAVFTHADSPGEVLWFDPVGRLARADGFPVHEVSAARVEGPAPYLPLVEAARPDVILSAYFRTLIPSPVLAIPQRGAYNLHGSLLPRYRGRAPVNWVLVNGETQTGMTLHHMTRAADAGDIVGQVRLAIGPDETAPELQRRLDDAAEDLLLRWLPEIERGSAPRTPQDLSKGSRFGRRGPEDGRFEWTWPARRIHNLVRAVTRPFPGAYTQGPGGRITLWKTRVADGPHLVSLRPGEVKNLPGVHHPVAGTGAGLLELVDFTGELPQNQ